MKYVIPSRSLRTALVWDVAASGMCALLQIMQPHLAARLFGVTLELVVASAVVLMTYAVLLLWLSSGPALAKPLIGLIVGVNIAWAAGCLGLALLPATVTPAGVVYLLLQAVAAICCSVAQAIGLRRSVSAPDSKVGLALRNTL